MKELELIQYVERFLLDDSSPQEEEDFVCAVCQAYLLDLTEKGYHMGLQTAEVIEELQGEIRDMLRKKIYGHFSIRDFQKHRDN